MLLNGTRKGDSMIINDTLRVQELEEYVDSSLSFLTLLNKLYTESEGEYPELFKDEKGNYRPAPMKVICVGLIDRAMQLLKPNGEKAQ